MSDLFGPILRAHRTRHHWSQEKLALEAEIDLSLLSRLETGRRNPTRKVLAKLVPLLDLSAREADALYVAAGFVPPDADVATLLTALATAREEAA